MSTMTRFMTTTLLGGLLVLLPLLLVYLMLDELLDQLLVLATPLMQMLPSPLARAIGEPLWAALLLLVLIAFGCGLALRSRRLTSLGQWLERRTLNRFPVYRALKGLTHGMFSSDHQQRFDTAIWSYNEHCQQLVYVVEKALSDESDSYSTILVPDAPGGFSGSVMRVHHSQLRPVPASIGEISAVLGQWGVGMSELVARSDQP